METVISWMVAIMFTIAPYHPTFITGAEETEKQMESRYESIAQDVISVAYDQNEDPIYFGKRGRLQSACVILTIAFFESGFKKHVDYNIGKHARGDKGNSWCMMQLNIGKGPTHDGWYGPELIDDRTKCFMSGYRSIKRSFGACRAYPHLDGLTAYGSGRCYSPSKTSRKRLNFAMMLFQKAPKIDDETIMNDLNAHDASVRLP